MISTGKTCHTQKRRFRFGGKGKKEKSRWLESLGGKCGSFTLETESESVNAMPVGGNILVGKVKSGGEDGYVGGYVGTNQQRAIGKRIKVNH